MDAELEDLFSLTSVDYEIESADMITPRQIRLEHKRRLQRIAREKNASVLLGELPAPGESVHIVSDGKFDNWNFIPAILEKSGRPATEAYFSTWTTNRTCSQQLLDMMESGQIQNVTYVTGVYFKRRETAVYAHLLKCLEKMGGRLKALENHAKVALLKIDPDYYVMEGSANFTSNPRIEQNIITNDKALYDFHRGWIESIFAQSRTV